MDELSKAYDPNTVEPQILEKWDNSGYANPDNLPGERTKPFTIVMPPPNANGHLHAGHALFITLEDIMIRFRRMMGDRALWIPGADHAGFETQVVYEKKLEKEGRSRFGMDSKQLYEEILAFTLENKKHMENEVRALGASCDWSREKFTLDDDVVATVHQTFLKMFNDGLVYRGRRIVNWCPKHQTSLSDVETASVEEVAPLYYFTYGPFTIATARPETKFGDKYIVMHPDDKRYAEYTDGQTIELEWINGPITATIIKDDVIDPAFGTGVMTITPQHDATDFGIAERHHLAGEQILDFNGRLLPVAGEFSGMKIAEARPKIVAKLEAKGLVAKIDTVYAHIAKRCYKCQTAIEPQVKDQWFVKMQPLAKLALEAVDKGDVKFIPDNFEKIFRYWMTNTLDWNISRQIVWGIPIPAWLCDDCHEYAANLDADAPTCPKCNQPMRKDTDTFDTWFSSGQWPLIVTGYPNGKDYAKHYPTDVMETGHDLIFRWVPRMVIFGLYLAQKAPFHTVYLHGLVNDTQGKKMSKSKGNVVSPLDLMAKYGTDALRMGLVVGNTPGMDLALSEDRVKGYKHFANKIWNASKFVLMSTTPDAITYALTPSDAEELEKLHAFAKEITEHMERYQLYLAAEKLYHEFWHNFADVIIERAKEQIKTGDEAAQQSAERLLAEELITLLTLLHPFMPFITEHVWAHLPANWKSAEVLMIAPWKA